MTHTLTHSHTLTYTTQLAGLDKGSVCSRDLYLTTHFIHNR